MMKQKNCKDSGFTLIELLVSSAIVLFAIAALFVGIQFTENQIFRNYRVRRAMLIASGKLEYNNFFRKQKSGFMADPNSTPIYGRSYILDKTPSNRNIDIELSASYSIDYEYGIIDRTYRKTTIVVEGEWNEPSRNNKRQSIKLIEDYYDPYD